MPDSPDPVAEAIPALVEANEQARSALLDAVAGLTEEQQRQEWIGDAPPRWSVRDVLAHLFEWENGYAHALERIARGERPEIPDYDPEQTDDVFNALVTERNRHLEWDDLLAHLLAAHQRHEVAVRNLAGKVTPDRFEPGRTARRLSETAGHEREHTDAILDWRRRHRI